MPKKKENMTDRVTDLLVDKFINWLYTHKAAIQGDTDEAIIQEFIQDTGAPTVCGVKVTRKELEMIESINPYVISIRKNPLSEYITISAQGDYREDLLDKYPFKEVDGFYEHVCDRLALVMEMPVEDYEDDEEIESEGV